MTTIEAVNAAADETTARASLDAALATATGLRDAWYALDASDKPANRAARVAFEAARAEYEAAYAVAVSRGWMRYACDRCGGTGRMPYSVYAGVCFRCDGKDSRRFEVGEPERVYGADVLRRRESKRLAAVAKAEAERAAALAVGGPIFRAEAERFDAALRAHNAASYAEDEGTLPAGATVPPCPDCESFVGRILERVYLGKRVTPAQAKAVEGAIEQDAARENARRDEAARAAESPIVDGRQTIEGEVVMARRYESDFGATDKIMIKDDAGRRYFGTAPGLLWGEFGEDGVRSPAVIGGYDEERRAYPVARGNRIRLVGTVEAKEPGFGFYKRPAKVEILAAGGADGTGI